MIEVIVILVINVIIIGVIIYKCLNAPEYDKISFKESLDLASLPIITFTHNKRKFNFLLDTGANKSIINERELFTCDYVKLESTDILMGMDGIERKVTNIVLPISYKNKSYEEVFQVTDISNTFDEIKKSTGVTVHGILGSNFFQKYKYILDFDELVAYSKSYKK